MVHMLLVRQTFNDRNQEQAAQLSLKRLNASETAPPLDPAIFARRLIDAAQYTENTARLFCDWSQRFQAEHHNCLPLGDQSFYQRVGGDPNILYYHGYWEPAEDEAMLIHARLPKCEFWNFQLNNYWMESLDYSQHRIHLSQHGAVYREDGSVTIVVAHRDPGLPNWLSTAGHSLGPSLFRLIGAGSPAPAEIETQIVSINDIATER